MARTGEIGRKKMAGALALLSFFSLLLVCGLRYAVFSGFEAASWDLRQRAVSNPAHADQSIKLIIVDQHSLEQLRELYGFSWPIPRDFYSAVVKFLTRAGARGLAFDLIISEPSVYGEDDDRNFTAALSGALPVVSALSLGEKKGEQVEAGEQGALIKTNSFRFSDLAQPVYNSALLPFPALAGASALLGAVNAIPDQDGVIRRYLLAANLHRSNGTEVNLLGLASALFLAAEGPQEFRKAIDRAGEAAGRQSSPGPIIGYHGPAGSYPIYSLSDIIQSWAAIEEGKAPQVNLDEFKNSWVFVGVWAPGLMDQRITPLDSRGLGVAIHAAALDNLINGGFVRRAPWVVSAAAAFPFLLLVVAGILFVNRAGSQAAILGLGFLGFIFGAVQLARNGIWIDLFVPFLVLCFSAAAAAVFRYLLEGQRSRFLRQAFQYYVSADVIDRLIAEPGQLSLGGERREVTLFFSDIAGFTSISERLEPEAVSALLNEYLTLMTDAIQCRGGTVDKYVGDAVVAFWNAPLAEERHRQLAVEAAIECQLTLAKLRAELSQRFGVELHTRIGIHTGIVTVGNFGSKNRFNYTVIGDAANLASRLEGANKIFGSGILVSEETKRGVDSNIGFRLLGRIAVVGREQPVTVYEPLGYRPEWSQSRAAEYQDALALIEQGKFGQACEALKRFPECPAAAMYLQKISQIQKTPPNGHCPDDPLLIKAGEK